MKASMGGQVAAFVVVVLLSAPGCNSRTTTKATIGARAAAQSQTSTAPVDPELLEEQIKTFCGDCHGFSPPSSFAKKDWAREVERGYKFYRESGRLDLPVPVEADVIAYYEERAPEALTFDRPVMASHPLPTRFRRQTMEISKGDGRSGVSWIGFISGAEAGGQLLFADMHVGEVGRVVLGETLQLDSLGNLGHPACVEPADLDSDGQPDYLVADLGSFLPADHDQGRVVWLHPDGSGGLAQSVLADGIGRVAQAVDGDFDGDGDTDVLVAEFGWIRTGKILLLRRTGDDADGVPQFQRDVVDPRHGTSHVRPIDWEGDGDLDFVALISQEYEHVELFLNDGSGKFSPELIYAAGDPTFGSSGIELVDLDADGDMDVLHTNGDSMDSADLKPFHAVRWLENGGSLPFKEHVLAQLPGAYKAVAVDFDEDQDLDVAVLSFPPAGKPPPTSIVSFDELVVLEQTAPRKFERHSLDSPVGGTALAAGDFDRDGDIDLAHGSFSEDRRDGWLSLLWNEGRASSGSRPVARDAAN